MITNVLISLLAVACAGLLIKVIQEKRDTESQITWKEFGIGMAIATLLIAPLTSWIGWKLAQKNQLTFYEYVNGWEMAAIKSGITCTRDGSCHWDYDCDPYIVMVSYSCNCDSKGNNCSTCQRPETRYHSCPYSDIEYNYSVQTTLGFYPIANNVFPLDPQSHRWRKRTSIPQGVVNQAGIGDPTFWTEVNNRCNANRPGPVTKRHDYANYILASDRTILKNYSGDVEMYKKANLLPAFQKGIVAFYHADKAHFVGFRPNDVATWQNTLEHFNSSFGTNLQGNLQMVFVKDDIIAANPDRYILTLQAYWQNTEVFGHDVLAKNDVIVVAGTDGKTITWSRAFTGMPLGNEKLIVLLRDGLKGMELSPAALLGPAQSLRMGAKVIYPLDGSAGAVSKILLGIDDPSAKFKRVSMSGKDGSAGFLYLKDEIRLSSGQMWLVFIVTFVLSSGVWIWASIHRDPSEDRGRSFTNRNWR